MFASPVLTDCLICSSRVNNDYAHMGIMWRHVEHNGVIHLQPSEYENNPRSFVCQSSPLAQVAYEL